MNFSGIKDFQIRVDIATSLDVKMWASSFFVFLVGEYAFRFTSQHP